MSAAPNTDATFGLLDRVTYELFLDTDRVCIRCNETFTLRGNLGTWKCPSFHPQSLTVDGREYACCHRRPGSDGCCAADHVDKIDIKKRQKSFKSANTTVMTFEQFRGLAVKKDDAVQYVQAKSWRRDDKTAAWVIARVDFARYDEKRNLMQQPSAVGMVYAMERWRPDAN